MLFRCKFFGLFTFLGINVTINYKILYAALVAGGVVE